MAFVHRKLLSSTFTIIITIPPSPCPPQLCKLPPPPPPPHEHHLVPTGMTIMACVMGFFFILGMVCMVAGRKYLKRIVSRRRNPPPVFLSQDLFLEEHHVAVTDHPIWLINFVGLQQSVIDSITICKYKRGDGLIEGTECSVCLGEFEEDDDLRLLPKCSHAFHLPCIDTWLRSHKNCPLCRAPVVSSTAAVASEPVGIDSSEETQLEGSESGLDHQQVGEDVARSEIDGTGDVGFGSATPNITRIRRKSCDSGALGVEGEVQPLRRSVSMNVSSASMIYDAVANSGEGQGNPDGAESGVFKNHSKVAGSGSSRNTSTSTSLCRLMKSASFGRILHKGPVSMKRSSSSRYCRSLDSILPM